ncbi:hypothetical protein [Aliterella atlantica]|uniref:Uncharacterized protein n=1 Tax=Aliterella atlantica CENA595 TaxID=1618023 RepID=A0A0D8ZVY1_9CYAN|nr:hypothetical protein [Aliterella atlantica]KJH71381.1 hypothetical protein UH38_12535 [Aliterella atlantica CENA595]
MKYIVGLIIFSSIGSFVIVDAIALSKEIGKTNNRYLFVECLRLVVIAAMAAVGFLLAQETFTQPNDGLLFLAIGAIAAFVIYALGIKRRATQR